MFIKVVHQQRQNFFCGVDGNEAENGKSCIKVETYKKDSNGVMEHRGKWM